MPKVELGRTRPSSGLQLTRDLLAIIGMDSPQPLLRSVTDLMIFTTNKADPSRREMNPVRRQIPVPEGLTVPANVRMLVIHTLD
jgi:hypothetical protein